MIVLTWRYLYFIEAKLLARTCLPFWLSEVLDERPKAVHVCLLLFTSGTDAKQERTQGMGFLYRT